MVEKITSVNNQKVKDACKLKTSKGRNETGLFLIEGFHILEMALKSGVVKSIFTNKIIEGIDEKITQYLVDDFILNKISYMPSNQGVIGICETKFNDIEHENLLVFLDNISDPGNMGTILRTCLAFGVKNVLVSEGSVSIFNDKVLMSSQGAIFNLNIKKVNYEDIKNLKNEYKIISSTLSEKSVNFTDLKLENNQKYIIVFGNESRGISEETIKLTDIFTKIPMNSIDSLNVGVAAGIIIYYLAIENKLY